MRQAYTEFGDRRNPSILFLHGIRLGRDIWTPHARALVGRYHVVAVDLPGHGALVDVPFTKENVRDVVSETIRTTCASPPLLVGYSLGGYVAMEYAAHHPGETSALLLAGCLMDYAGWKRWPYEMSARLSQMVPDPVLDVFAHVSLHAVLPRAIAHSVEQIPFNRRTFGATAEVARSNGERFSDVLATYRKPVLFLQGEYDVVFRLDEQRFLKRVPQARLKLIRHTDHTAPLRRPQEFTSIVADFAASVFR